MPISQGTLPPLPPELGGQTPPLSLAVEIPEVAEQQLPLPKGEIIGNALLCQTDDCKDIVPFALIADHMKVKHGFMDATPVVPVKPMPTPELPQQVVTQIEEQIAHDEIIAAKPERDAKGHFLPGHTESVGNDGGRPCKFCENESIIMKKTTAYIREFLNAKGGRGETPFIEELALKLEVDENTMTNWATKKRKDTEELEHPMFLGAFNTIMGLQKLQLKRIGLKGRAQHFAQFLLSANHDLISAEKRIVAGDSQEPLNIRIVDDKQFEED